jgi:hypothetical protein
MSLPLNLENLFLEKTINEIKFPAKPTPTIDATKY